MASVHTYDEQSFPVWTGGKWVVDVPNMVDDDGGAQIRSELRAQPRLPLVSCSARVLEHNQP